MGLKIILTGATGMVGEGVLLECLGHPQVSEVLSISRRPAGRQHARLKEYLVPDFLQLDGSDPMLRGYDACFFCAGVSSVGMKEDKYRLITYDITLHFARAVLQQNPQMTFIYVSGKGTDSSEQGRLMWARVKGKTENDLMKLGFKNVYNFRPGFMKATPGQVHLLSAYKYFAWMYPLLKTFFPRSTSTLQQVGRAMISSVVKGCDKPVLEVKDINALGGA
jgi:uncharacterized protein YbjT (DUF2867 family)